MADRGEVPPTFQIAPEQGTFMQLLTRALGVRRAVEIGTFTGYSALCVARGLPDDGSLLCLDTSEEWTAVARRYWDRAGLADRIELRLGDAHDGGVVLLDNTLRNGRVLDPQNDDDRAVVELNAALAADPRWETVLLPLADGLTMLRRR
jgi:caffeoyl-CoA O-methyltransferase